MTVTNQRLVEILTTAMEKPEIANALIQRVINTLNKQPEPEPVAWVAYENGEKHGIDFDEDEIAKLPVGTMLYPAPPHFLDPAKVARLMDEVFERGKKEIDMEQVKDIAQKLADCALLNSAPPQREWQGLTDEEIEKLYLGSFDEGQFARAIEAKLKEKNT